jgi:hypothetical protein
VLNLGHTVGHAIEAATTSIFVRAQAKTTSSSPAGSRTSMSRTRSQSSPPAISPVFTTSTKPAASSSGGRVVSTVGSASTAIGWW